MIVLQTSIAGMTPKHGKVRDIYDFGDSLLLVSSDRISAFDWVLPTGIPDKGKVLNQLSAFWFRQLGVPNHLITTNVGKMPFPNNTNLTPFDGRSMLGKKCKTIPIECVVRGYLSGSGWKEYQKSGSVCGIKLPNGLRESDPLPNPIFTPSTKAETGHDENITFDQMVEIVGQNISEELRQNSLEIFRRGSELAIKKGIIIADTKFEFGFSEGQLTLIDEVLTPDSSRFWPADSYQPGQGQPSFDKQFVRDWLTQTGWDKNSPPPELPNEIVKKTQEKYLEVFQILTDRSLNQTQ
jgi:phosphoribosylaminoimidazole-succinocarboxamide synthase